MTDAARLDDPPPDADTVPSRTCLECGGGYRPKGPHGDFCGDACRKAFNNRRMRHGAELYDLVMALRFDRQTATKLKVWRLINRLAAIYRREDMAERAGRPSWRHPRAVIAGHPYLKADILNGGKRQ